MSPMDFPLRWESTGDQWWYASPIDWAAANGHYDLVRELLRIDNNHLISLTSLRRIRRLETVWDDEAQFDDTAMCRSNVAKKLFVECESRKENKNSLIKGGYGGWLMYTAASAGDSGFVQELLKRNPLLVFGEGEYGVTDILYAAAKSGNCDVFRLLYDFAVSPRFLTAQSGVFEEQIGDIPVVYKKEMMNRAVHAAARGGNLTVLKEVLADCTDVLGLRDKEGSTVLHAAAGKGQVKVVKDLVKSFDIINSTDDQGNTALHIAAYRGQSAVVDFLILTSPSLMSVKNNSGETFLHMAVSGFQSHTFRRLDRQKVLMKNLICGTNFDMQDVINAVNNQGRTALHMAIVGNVHSHLVELLMSAKLIDVNIRDNDSMTPLDLLRQRPRSPSSDLLIRQLVSAGGMFGCQDYNTRRVMASRLKMHGDLSSPGTSFRISDAEIFLHTGLEIVVNDSPAGRSRNMSSSSIEVSQLDVSKDTQVSSINKKLENSMSSAAKRFKRALHWPKTKEIKKPIHVESIKKWSSKNSEETPPAIPLRERFSNVSSLQNNKRTLSLRSHQPSPTSKKRSVEGDSHAMPHLNPSGRSRSSSFSKSSMCSSPSSVDLKQKGVFVSTEVAGPSCSNQSTNDEHEKGGNFESTNKRLRRQYFCFGGSGLSTKTSVGRERQNSSVNSSIISMVQAAY